MQPIGVFMRLNLYRNRWYEEEIVFVFEFDGLAVDGGFYGMRGRR